MLELFFDLFDGDPDIAVLDPESLHIETRVVGQQFFWCVRRQVDVAFIVVIVKTSEGSKDFVCCVFHIDLPCDTVEADPRRDALGCKVGVVSISSVEGVKFVLVLPNNVRLCVPDVIGRLGVDVFNEVVSH